MNSKGITRLTILLIVLVGTLSILALFPVYKSYKQQVQKDGCVTQLRSAKSSLSISTLSNKEIETNEENFVIMDQTIPGWTGHCPGGGDVYALKEKNDLGWELFCGLHGEDTKKKCRLNAYNAYSQIENEEIEINQKKYKPLQVQEPVTISELLKHPGVYVQYNIDQCIYFAYSDGIHCAIYKSKDGWSGTAFV